MGVSCNGESSLSKPAASSGGAGEEEEDEEDDDEDDDAAVPAGTKKLGPHQLPELGFRLWRYAKRVEVCARRCGSDDGEETPEEA